MNNWNYNMHKLVATEYERKATRNAETRERETENQRMDKRNRRQR